MRAGVMTIIGAGVLSAANVGCQDERREPVMVARAEPITGPDGTRHWAIECINKSLNCLKQAGSTCPDGYAVLERDGQTISEFQTDTSASAWAGGSTALGRSRTTTRELRDYRGSLVIKCRSPSARSRVTHAAPLPAVSPSAGSLADADAGVGTVEVNPYLDPAK